MKAKHIRKIRKRIEKMGLVNHHTNRIFDLHRKIRKLQPIRGYNSFMGGYQPDISSMNANHFANKKVDRLYRKINWHTRKIEQLLEE